eukprot:TRINITY_DN14596_c0_g1_i5.p1 TRINITY_DN14596_c0_g1~~TRINITY_DN14596_c0_g1_i5.p1  ORF type:complete len:301 (+),score=91.37 TRINITY_DN14596_c0_g1_i5:106-1008(+)
MAQQQPVTVVDAFTKQPFSGNQAAVCVVGAARYNSTAWKQTVAREMNLSETAFVCPSEDRPGTFKLCWFTPACEVDLCGHATLGAAHALWHNGLLPPDREAVFHTNSGELRCSRQPDGRVSMDFPQEVATADGVSQQAREQLLRAVRPTSGEIAEVLCNRMDFMVVLSSRVGLEDIKVDYQGLIDLAKSEKSNRGVIVTAQAAPGEERDGAALDCVARCFFPAAGINEDPVTGSAHCAIGPYWAQRLGKSTVRSYQCSDRGGVVTVDVRGNGRCSLSGHAAVTLQGVLEVGGLQTPPARP